MKITELSRLQQLLRHSQENFRSLFQLANDAMALSDPQGMVLEANSAYFQLYGYSPEEVIGHSFAIIFPPEQREWAVEQYQKNFIDEQQALNYESTILRKDGTTRVVQARASYLTQDGQRWAMLSVIRDITEQKKQAVLQQFLIEAGKTLSASLDYEATLTSVAQLATPQIADWCAVDLVDEQGSIQRVAVTHVNPEKIAQAYEFHRQYPPSAEGEGSFAKVIRTGQSDYYPVITDEMLAASAPDPRWLQMIRALGFQSSLMVPLTARGRTFGVITFVNSAESGRTLSMEDVTLAEELGRIAGLAVDNARLYSQTQLERERFEVTFRSIGDAIITADTQGLIKLMNPLAEQLTGWTEGEGIQQSIKTLFKRVSQDAYQQLAVPLQHLLQSSEISTTTYSYLRRRDGQEIPVDLRLTPIRDQNEQLTGMVLVFRDMSEPLQAEQERQRLTLLVEHERQRLQNILENVPGMVWEGIIVGDKQQLHYVNSYAEKLLGYPADEWLMIPGLIWKLVHPEDLDIVREHTHDFYAGTRNAITFEFRAISKEGHVIPLETYMSAIPASGDHPIRVYGLLMDISQRKQIESALEQYAVDLKRSNEELEQFAYIASHDLQEPLRMISSYLQLLQKRYSHLLDQDGQDFMGFALDGAARMKRLIDDLLMYSRVKTDERAFAPFSSETALKTALANLALKIEETQATVIYDALPVITGNQNQFVQLFQNLVSNALKFHGAALPEIHIHATRQDKEWLFAVRDNGIGIQQQDLERIFLMFQRLHSRTQYAGTGIGLAVCKKVIELHRGTIWAESKVGEGTTFYFTLPVDPS